MKVILPNRAVDVSISSDPIFFLAGPVDGGDDWQFRCAMEIEKLLPHCWVAIPRRYDVDHPVRNWLFGSEDGFYRQLLWERYYLEQASRRGCTLFWLPCESKVSPRKEGPYARDTYGELGEWRGRLMHDRGLRLVVGGEAGFHGLDVITRNFQAVLGDSFRVHDSLDETIRRAIEKAQARV